MNNYKQEFENYLNELNDELKINEVAKDLYYGFYVFDGPINDNPDVLFIGINPGVGDEEKNYKVDLELGNRISYLDKFDNEYTYHLANNMLSYFKAGGINDNEIVDLLKNRSVKMNMFPIITKDGSDVKKALLTIGKDKWIEFYKKCMDFVFDVVRDIKPKLVILEGKSVYNELIEVCIENTKTWDKEGNFSKLVSEELKTTFLTINRGRDGGSDKEKVGKIIKEILIENKKAQL